MLIGQTITVIGGGIGGLAAALAAARAGAQVTVLEQAPRDRRGRRRHPDQPQWLGCPEGARPRRGPGRRRPPPHRRAAARFPARGGGLHPAAHPRRPPVLRRAPGRPDRHPRPRLPRGRCRHPPEHAGRGGDGRGRPRRCLTFAEGPPERHGLTVAADGVTRPRAPRSTPGPAPSSPARSPGARRSPMTAPCRRRRMSSWARAATWCATRCGGAVSSTSWRWRNATPGPPRAGTTPTTRPTCAAPSRISAPRSATLLDRVETVHLWGLFRHPVAPVWTEGQLALLGDAAHPTLPFLAQGANMALEDAWSLVAALAADPDTATRSGPMPSCAARAAARIVQAAEDNATNYHLRPGPWRLAAHGALRLAGASRPTPSRAASTGSTATTSRAAADPPPVGSPSSFRKYRSGEREGAKRPSPGSAPKATIQNDKVASAPEATIQKRIGAPGAAKSLSRACRAAAG
jgi:salicylate hydroxylase